MIETQSPWDDFQRDALDALGHVVYVTREAPPPSPLLLALARAANVDVAALPPVSIPQLRTPDAKRALWPRLRALRKASHA
jgi:hypothetical protein